MSNNLLSAFACITVIGFSAALLPRLAAPSDTYINDSLFPTEASTESNFLSIVSQPSDVYCNVDDVIEFSVVASGEGLTYQWYVKSVNQSDFKPSGLTGFDTDTLTVRAILSRLGAQYKCLVSDSNGYQIWTDTVRFYYNEAEMKRLQEQNAFEDVKKGVQDDVE